MFKSVPQNNSVITEVKMRFKTISIFIVLFAVSVFGSDIKNNTDKGFLINSWLKLGPLKITALESENFKSDRDKANQRYIDERIIKPIAGKSIEWRRGVFCKWKKSGNISTGNSKNSVYYFAVYPDAFRKIKVNLAIENIGENLIDIYLDGKLLNKNYNKKNRSLKITLDLLNEKHILLIKLFSTDGIPVSPSVYIQDRNLMKRGDLKFSTDLNRRVNFRNILNMVSVSGIKISPDGRFSAVSLKRTNISGKSEKWTEIVDIRTGKTVLNTETIGNIKGLQWMKNSRSFSFSRSDKNRDSIFVFNLKNMSVRKILGNIESLSDFSWSPDNSFIVYSRFKKKDMGKSFKYISEIPDRSKFGSYENSIYIFFPKGGVTHRISGYAKNLGNFMISPDSNKILLIKDISDAKNRPYFRSVFFLLDVKTLKSRKLFESNFATPVSWSPDSGKILFSGGPSSFGGIGRSPSLNKGVIPNEYDNQLYMYDLSSTKVTPLTVSFMPSVSSVFWNRKDGNIYVKAEDRSYVKLFKYTFKRKNFFEIKTPVDVIGNIGFSSFGSTAVFWGSGSTMPYKLYSVDLKRGKVSLLKDYNRNDFNGVKLGKLENWNYRKPDGSMIIGRIYYPPGFNAARKYPCIVYYYGGTSPVERSFGGRYPFNWYAANGYIVYVLQPSGATGFGQKFSAVHVNDWGNTTSKEIIGATKELLRTHLFIDPKRVGAMGASYGGFMTQYLATQTDIFSAFISHAGISALSSYWGVGDWGYTYSGIATANSFPWNRKDLYVGHSPLFMADRINTPLLLLHGDVDNNVPPGESYQMFLALKLLGKEVALVTFKGQSHWILEYGKRVRWMKTIIAWFDKWLKGDSLYWDSLYKKFEHSSLNN